MTDLLFFTPSSTCLFARPLEIFQLKFNPIAKCLEIWNLVLIIAHNGITDKWFYFFKNAINYGINYLIKFWGDEKRIA